jgi:hypothetical protein
MQKARKFIGVTSLEDYDPDLYILNSYDSKCHDALMHPLNQYFDADKTLCIVMIGNNSFGKTISEARELGIDVSMTNFPIKKSHLDDKDKANLEKTVAFALQC